MSDREGGHYAYGMSHTPSALHIAPMAGAIPGQVSRIVVGGGGKRRGGLLTS